METPAFITGSQKYGIPNDRSDVDLVVLLSENDLFQLLDLEDDAMRKQNSYGDALLSLKFGRLNILCTTNVEDYNVWVEGTKELIAQKPVTRDTAVKCFSRRREELRNKRELSKTASKLLIRKKVVK